MTDAIPTLAPVFVAPPPLPRGPHRLSAEAVSASQRQRLLWAVVAVVAEEGYERATLAAIIRRAGVSRATFYSLFNDKRECLIAAYQHFIDILLERMALRLPPKGDWETFAGEAIRAALGLLDDDRAAARVMIVEMEAAGRETRMRTLQATTALAALIAQRLAHARTLDPTIGDLPDTVIVGWVRGARATIKDALDASPDEPLAVLAPTLTFWLRATILGAADAARMAP